MTLSSDDILDLQELLEKNNTKLITLWEEKLTNRMKLCEGCRIFSDKELREKFFSNLYKMDTHLLEHKNMALRNRFYFGFFLTFVASQIGLIIKNIIQ